MIPRALVVTLLFTGALFAGHQLASGSSAATVVIRVDDTGDEPVLTGSSVCDADPDPSVTRCTLRAALEVLAAKGRPGRVELGRLMITRTGSDPYPVADDLTLVGEGSSITMIMAGPTSPLLAPAKGVRIEWRGLTVVREQNDGNPPAASEPSSMQLTDVRLAEDMDHVGAAGGVELAMMCVVGRHGNVYVRDSTVTDPSALRAFPGALIR